MPDETQPSPSAKKKPGEKGESPKGRSQARTHYVSLALSQQKPERLQEKQGKYEQGARDLVFQILRDSECSECGAEIEQNSFLHMEAGQPLCLSCAGMDDLEYLPRGVTALTRRACKYSSRVAVVVRFSRSRKRYERQGVMVEGPALEKAEQECLDDEALRAAARERGAKRRRKEDEELVARMAAQISKLFPGCPASELTAIARHTAKRGSGRIGRTEAGRTLKETALRLAVAASVRHRHTDYDELLMGGLDRAAARHLVRDRVEEILEAWEGKS
jgi:hypothetical protein